MSEDKEVNIETGASVDRRKESARRRKKKKLSQAGPFYFMKGNKLIKKIWTKDGAYSYYIGRTVSMSGTTNKAIVELANKYEKQGLMKLPGFRPAASDWYEKDLNPAKKEN